MASVIDNLFNHMLPGLQKAMDLTWRRNEAIMSNVANAETPQYRAVDLQFANELKRAFEVETSSMVKTDGNHLDVSQNAQAHLIPDLSGMTKPDGNNVDVDVQMGKLAYNSSKYMQAAGLVRKQFQILSNAIRGTA